MTPLVLLTEVLLPIALLIGVGIVFALRTTVDQRTLAALNFRIFVPALAFVKLLEAEITAADAARLAAFATVQAVVLALLGAAAAALPPLRGHRPLAVLATASYNIGNYGIPFVALAFGTEWLALVIVVLLVQNVATFLLGPPLLAEGGLARSGLALLRVPVFWAMALAGGLRWLGWQVPEPGMHALRYLADGLIPVALVTLGVQLARTPPFGGGAPLAMLTALRLVGGVAVAWCLVRLSGFDQRTAAVLIACGGLPVAVNVFILCSEYRRDEALAAQAVFWTTVLSAATVPVAVLLAQR